MSNLTGSGDEFRNRIGNHTHGICMPFDMRIMDTRGIFFGENPLSFIQPIFMLQIILTFFACRGLYFILRPLKQPQFTCDILGGILLGPSLLGYNKAILNTLFPVIQMMAFNTVAAIGGSFFVFITAVKTDIDMIVRAPKRVWVIGTMSFIVPLFVNLFSLLILQQYLPGIVGGSFLFVVASACAVAYVPVIVHALDELNMLHTELGQLATSAALINELIGLVLICVTIACRQGNKFEAILALLCITFLLCFVFLVVRPTILRIIQKTPEDKPVNEIYIVAIMLLAFVMGVATDMLGTTSLPGLLLLGLIIPDGPPLGSALVERLELLASLFLYIFFARVGYLTDASSVHDWKAFGTLQFIVLVGHLGKGLGVFVASIMLNIRFRNAILLSLILNLWGVLELVGFIRWLLRDGIDKQSFATLVLTNLVVTAVTSPLIEYLYKPQRLDASHPTAKVIRTLQSTPQEGELRILTCIHDEQNVHNIIRLLEASNPNIMSPLCVYVIHLTQFIGGEVPLLVPYKQQSRRLKPKSSEHIIRAFMNYSKNSSGFVTMQPFSLIGSYRTMHESVCNLAQDKHIPLIILPFHGHQQSHIRTTAERNFSSMIQVSAPCTVGILLERGIRTQLDFAHFSCNVAVVFLGGADDREALALAIRMSGHPSVYITLLRISVKRETNDDINDMERQLDYCLLQEFKEKNFANACAIYREVETYDEYARIMDVIRSLGNNLDLVIVGRRRSTKAQFEKEIMEWMEYPELGVMGDMIASPDTFGGMVSILVMQQSGKDIGAFSHVSTA